MSESHGPVDLNSYRRRFDALCGCLRDWEANDRRSELCLMRFSQIPKLDTSKMNPNKWGVLYNFEKIDVLVNQNRLREFKNILKELGGILERYKDILQGIKDTAIQMQNYRDNHLIPYEKMVAVGANQPSTVQYIEWTLDIAKRAQKEYLERVQIFNRIRYEELDSIGILIRPWTNKPIHMNPDLIEDYLDRCKAYSA